MAKNDGIDRTSVRNANLTKTQIGNAQRHSEREKESYTNPDITPERAALNIITADMILQNNFTPMPTKVQ